MKDKKKRKIIEEYIKSFPIGEGSAFGMWIENRHYTIKWDYTAKKEPIK